MFLVNAASSSRMDKAESRGAWMFKNRVLLITGGTGSFGNAALGKFLDTEIGEIRIFSRDEKKQDDMRHRYQNSKLKFYIGDVRDYSSIHAALRGVDYVFSAAALKQVPSCEFYPIEAVRTNVLGTENTLRAALAQGVKRVVVLSTDKAVNPINAMGMSKALMEKVTIAMGRNIPAGQSLMCNTRYGNVMASRGSVIPIFARQISQGKPITITDPEMTRFMMSLPQAVELVLFAFIHGDQGDTFVQKAPAATIQTLALAMNKIFNANSDIKIMGTRHGEKKHECLVNREEMAKAEDLGDYFRIPSDTRDLDYTKYFEQGETRITRETEYTSENTQRLDLGGTVDLLMNVQYIKDFLARGYAREVD
jgi:UDP-glucose 4-epimerase